MRRGRAAAAVALALALLASAAPGFAQLTTNIDLNYVYTQEHVGQDVHANVTFNQHYEIRYETSLTSVYDFTGALRVDLQDAWSTKAATSSTVTPSLELSVKGLPATLTTVYEGSIATTGSFEEAGEQKIYSNSFTTTLQTMPAIWPEVTLKFQRQRGYQAWASDARTQTLEFTGRKDLGALRLEMSISLQDQNKIYPEPTKISTTTWSGNLTYKEVLWGGTEFETAYGVKESYAESESKGVASSPSETYTQSVRSRLKNTLALTPSASVGLSWEYQFEEDLLELSYDYKLKNKYALDLRWDLLYWLKIAGEARRETDLTAEAPGEDDTQSVTDTLRASFDTSLVDWFRVAGRAEVKWAQKVQAQTGLSVDHTKDEKYELIAKNRFGDFWDLTLGATTLSAREEGFLTDRETKLKAELRLRILDITVSPTYEILRRNEWQEELSGPALQRRSQDARLDFSYRLKLMDLFTATLSHQYGFNAKDELDQYLNFDHIVSFSEATKLNAQIAEFIRDMTLEGEIERKASDTAGDAEPQLIELAYRLKLDWRLDELTLGSSFTYNDKGDAYDDMTFNAKIGWKSDNLDVSGEYQLDKTFSQETSEKRGLNLKLNYKF